MLYAWDWPRAEREFREALRLNQAYSLAHLHYAQYLSAMARFDEAIAEVKRAQESDPLSLGINANVGLVLHWARECKQAVEQLENTIELDPNFGLAYWYLAGALAAQQRYEKALATIQKAIELTGGMPLAVASLGYIYGRIGERKKARQVLRELETVLHDRHVGSSVLTIIYAGLGDRAKFFECMNHAYEDHSPMLPFLKALPEYDAMRSDPRYDELLCRMGLACDARR